MLTSSEREARDLGVRYTGDARTTDAVYDMPVPGEAARSPSWAYLADMVHVLILSLDVTFAGLLRLNLERRGFGVQHQVWAACCDLGEAMAETTDLVIADLDCPPPAWWDGTRRVRARFPSHPLLLLGHDWPETQMVEACRPCRYLQKPFAIHDFIHAVGALASTAG